MNNKGVIKKKLIVIIVAVVLVILIIGGSVFAILADYKEGEVSPIIWSSLMTYSEADDTIELTKSADKDFVILNFADTQFDMTTDLSKGGVLYKTMAKCIDEVKPDLITFTGDNFWGIFTRQCQKKLISVMDSFEIPWAPVFGNHDREGNADLNYLGDVFMQSEYCLFQKGPYNIGGVGNYVINIKENGKVIHSLFMMDSGTGGDYVVDEEDYTYGCSDEEKGGKVGSGYEALCPAQIEWYKWMVKGIKEANDGTTVTSSLFIHIPLLQFDYAQKLWQESNYDPAMGFGEKNEHICSAYIDTGMFAAIKEMDSTKNVIVGHDHVNNTSILYEGVRLTYSTKTGKECYWVEDGTMNGGSVITVKSDGSTEVKHHLINDFVTE